jgi:hypothetical protein
MPAPCCPDGNDHCRGKRRLRAALLRAAVLLAVAFVVMDPAYGTPAHAGSPADTLSVFFTAETHGNLEPCACPRGPQGGLARRVGFLRGAAEAVRSRTGTALVLDAGGFFPEGEVPLRDDPAVARRFTALLLDGLARSGVQAVALDHGQRDFLERAAPRETRRLQEAFLEADPPGTPHVVDWGAHRVAIVALEETLTDDAVRVAGSAARARGDLVIVLARGDGFSGRRLARLSGADLVVLSRGARPEAPLLEGRSILVGCGIEGKEVGEVRIVLDAGESGTRGIPRVTGFQLHPMDTTVVADPGIARSVETLVRDAGPRAFVRNME